MRTNRFNLPRSGLLLVSTLLLCSCATLAGGPRLGQSSYGCMRAVKEQVPLGIPDKRQHCLAAGTIALHCSVAEAHMAGVGKEFTDIFDGGDPEWADIQADEAGIRCAKAGRSDASLAQCCAKIPPPH